MDTNIYIKIIKTHKNNTLRSTIKILPTKIMIRNWWINQNTSAH